MDPQVDLPDLVEDLEVNIDELTAALAPLLTTPLTTSASTLPLLDKAKLYVLAAYSIESLLYSTLQASGVNAKDHPIFRELGRLKGYFGKIKDIEDRGAGPAKPGQRLDVGAANRFIKHGLAGNEKYDLERKERMAREKARAHLKAAKIAKQVNKKFDDEGSEVQESVTPKKRSAEEKSEDDEQQVDDDDEDILTGLEDASTTIVAPPAVKKTKLSGADPMDIEAATSPAVSGTESTNKHKGKKNKSKKNASRETSQESPEAADSPASSKSKPRNRKGRKSANNAGAAAAVDVEQDTAEADKPKRGRGRPRKAK